MCHWESKASAVDDPGLLVAAPLSYTVGCVYVHGCGAQGFLIRSSVSVPMNRGSHHAALLGGVCQIPRSVPAFVWDFAMGSSGPGSGLQSQPLVVEGSLVLLLGFFHCGKSRLSNCASGQFLSLCY